MGGSLATGDFCLNAGQELVAAPKFGVINRAVFLQLPDAPRKKGAEEGAGSRVAQDPVKIEQWNDFGAIRPLIETPVQALELALWVADGFDITGVVRHEHSFAERGVYGRGMGKVVGLDHVGEKMHRRAASLGGQKHRVERNTIATKNLVEEGAARCFGIIEQEQEVTGLVAEKAPRGQADFLLIAGRNALSAPDHP